MIFSTPSCTWRRPIPQAREVKLEAGKNLTFATPTLRVKTGEAIRLTFHNPDVVPHNWVLVKPGMLRTVGELANRLIADPDDIADLHRILQQQEHAGDDVLDQPLRTEADRHADNPRAAQQRRDAYYGYYGYGPGYYGPPPGYYGPPVYGYGPYYGRRFYRYYPY